MSDQDVFLTGDGTSDLRFWTSFFNVQGANGSVSMRYFENNMDGAYSHTAYPPKQRGPEYDLAGNMTGDGYFTYVYDAANRLVEVSAGTYTWRFLYDPQGRRIRQELRDGGTLRYDSILVYDGPHPVHEFAVDGDTLHPGRSFFWGPDISNTYGGAGGIGGLYMIRDGADDYAVGYDGLGNVSALWHAPWSGSVQLAATFDGARQRGDGQALLARRARETGCPPGGRLRQYDAYGQIVRETGAAHLTPFRYQSKWHLAAPVPDAGNGPPVPFDLYDYGLRWWYHPDQGRFINRDPVGEAGGENLYAFVGNDPVNGRDFMGLMDLYYLNYHDVIGRDCDILVGGRCMTWEQYENWISAEGLGGMFGEDGFSVTDFRTLSYFTSGANRPVRIEKGTIDPEEARGDRDDDYWRNRCQGYADEIQRNLDNISRAVQEHALLSLMRGYLVEDAFSLRRDGPELVMKSVSTTLNFLGAAEIEGIASLSLGWSTGEIIGRFERGDYSKGLDAIVDTGWKLYFGHVEKRLYRTAGLRPIPGVNLASGFVDLHSVTVAVYEAKNARRFAEFDISRRMEIRRRDVRDSRAWVERYELRYKQNNCDKWLHGE